MSLLFSSALLTHHPPTSTPLTLHDALPIWLNGIPIPVLCHQQNQAPVGVCRVCIVDVGARVYPASCIRECEPGRSEEHTSELQSRLHLVWRLLLEKKKLMLSTHDLTILKAL